MTAEKDQGVEQPQQIKIPACACKFMEKGKCGYTGVNLPTGAFTSIDETIRYCGVGTGARQDVVVQCDVATADNNIQDIEIPAYLWPSGIIN